MNYNRKMISNTKRWKKEQPIPHDHYSAFKSLHTKKKDYVYRIKPLLGLGGFLVGILIGLVIFGAWGPSVMLIGTLIVAICMGWAFGVQKEWEEYKDG